LLVFPEITQPLSAHDPGIVATWFIVVLETNQVASIPSFGLGGLHGLHRLAVGGSSAAAMFFHCQKLFVASLCGLVGRHGLCGNARPHVANHCFQMAGLQQNLAGLWPETKHSTALSQTLMVATSGDGALHSFYLAGSGSPSSSCGVSVWNLFISVFPAFLSCVNSS